MVFGANPPEKRKSISVAPEKDVLAVVHQLAGYPVGKRGRPPTQPRPRLEHEHAGVPLRKRGARAEAGEARADDDDVEMTNAQCVYTRSSRVRAHVVAAIQARAGRGTRTGFVNTS